MSLDPSLAALELAGGLADMRALDQGVSVEEIVSGPLWLDGFPRLMQTEWKRLETALLKVPENWEVWTEWYVARLGGRPSSEALEIGRVRLPLDLWAQGPKVVNAQIKQLIQDDENKRANPQPLPLENIPSPFGFRISEQATIALAPSAANWPSFPHPSSKRDHEDRLDVCRTLAQDLISDLLSKRFQARQEYLEGLEKYVSRLPNAPGQGNILLAEAEVRTLRNLFAAEAEVLSIPFAAKLKTFLEQHIGLRVFYPDISNFYRDVQSGRIQEPLPLDAVEGIVEGIREYTPIVFEHSVHEAIEGSADDKATISVGKVAGASSSEGTQPVPPKDPLGEVDPHKASDFTFAGAVNNMWRVFLEGERIHRAADGWKKAGAALRPHVNDVLDWLNRFMNFGGSVPPPGAGPT